MAKRHVVEVLGLSAFCEPYRTKREAIARGRELRHYGHVVFVHSLQTYTRFVADASARALTKMFGGPQ